MKENNNASKWETFGVRIPNLSTIFLSLDVAARGLSTLRKRKEKVLTMISDTPRVKDDKLAG